MSSTDIYIFVVRTSGVNRVFIWEVYDKHVRRVLQIIRVSPLCLFVYLSVYVSSQVCPAKFKAKWLCFMLNPFSASICKRFIHLSFLFLSLLPCHLFIYTYTYIYIYAYIYVCICVCVCVCVCIYMYIYVCVNMYMCIYMSLSMYVCVCIYMWMHTHTHTHTYIYIYIYICMFD